MHDEIALLLQEARQRGDAVDIGHGDVEDDDVGVPALHLLDGVAAAAERGDDLHVRLGLDPARDHAADDDGIVDHHDADRLMRKRGAGRRCGDGETHRDYSLDATDRQNTADSAGLQGCDDQINPTS